METWTSMVVVEVMRGDWILDIFWKIEPTGFPDGLDMRNERQKKRKMLPGFGPKHLKGWSCHFLREEKEQDKQVERTKSRAWFLDILNLRCLFRHSSGNIQLAAWSSWERFRLEIKIFKTLSCLTLLISKKKCWNQRETAEFQPTNSRKHNTNQGI